jgi:hypothetical protein
METKIPGARPGTLHRAPSVGSLVKKVLAVNPNLSTHDIIAMVREATHDQGENAGEYSSVQVVDENKVMELARASLKTYEN